MKSAKEKHAETLDTVTRMIQELCLSGYAMDSKVLDASMRSVARFATHYVLPKIRYASGGATKLLGVVTSRF